MSANSKRMKTTKAQLEKDLAASQADATATQIALNDVLNNQVKWFRKGNHALGVCRPTGAHGGIVIARMKSGASHYSCAYYWERYIPHFKTLPSSDKEFSDQREIAFQAETYINREQSAEFQPERVAELV